MQGFSLTRLTIGVSRAFALPRRRARSWALGRRLDQRLQQLVVPVSQVAVGTLIPQQRPQSRSSCETEERFITLRLG